MSGPRYHIRDYEDILYDAKLMLKKLKENQRNFINKTGKHKEYIEKLILSEYQIKQLLEGST